MEALFDDLARCGRTDPGFARASYSADDIEAHAVMTRYAANLGLAVGRDAAAKTTMARNAH